MEFRLTITLGNEAMQTPEQVADVLRTVSARIMRECPNDDPRVFPGPYAIRDVSGNTVGSWLFASDGD